MTLLIPQTSGKPTYEIPLTFEPNIKSKQVILTLPEASYSLYFNLNETESAGPNLFLSCLSADEIVVYFGSYRCIFGCYINSIDNGAPHKFFFFNSSSSGDPVPNITFDTLNRTVRLYAVLR